MFPCHTNQSNLRRCSWYPPPGPKYGTEFPMGPSDMTAIHARYYPLRLTSAPVNFLCQFLEFLVHPVLVIWLEDLPGTLLCRSEQPEIVLRSLSVFLQVIHRGIQSVLNGELAFSIFNRISICLLIQDLHKDLTCRVLSPFFNDFLCWCVLHSKIQPIQVPRSS